MMVIFVLYYQSSHFCCWLKSTTLCNVFLITHTKCIVNSLSKSLPFCPWDTSDQTIETIDSKKYYCFYYLILNNEYWLPYQLRRCYHTNSDIATIPTRTLLPYHLGRCYHTNSDVKQTHFRLTFNKFSMYFCESNENAPREYPFITTSMWKYVLVLSSSKSHPSLIHKIKATMFYYKVWIKENGICVFCTSIVSEVERTVVKGYESFKNPPTNQC